MRERDLAHLVVVQQLRDVPGHEDPGVVAVEAEPVALLLYPGVQTPAVPPEAHTEQILVLGRVSQQETSLGLLVQQRFRLISAIKYNVEIFSYFLFLIMFIQTQLFQ